MCFSVSCCCFYQYIQYWSVLIEPWSPELQADSLSSEPIWKPLIHSVDCPKSADKSLTHFFYDSTIFHVGHSLSPLLFSFTNNSALTTLTYLLCTGTFISTWQTPRSGISELRSMCVFNFNSYFQIASTNSSFWVVFWQHFQFLR